MRAVIAIDSLKGSLSSIEAGQAIAEGIRKADAKADVVIRRWQMAERVPWRLLYAAGMGHYSM